MIDTHAHLNDKAFDSDREQVLQNAHSAGVDTIIDVAEDINSAKVSLNLFEENKTVWCTAGIHPHLATRLSSADILAFREILRHEKMVAVGEIGLDYYYNKQPREIQREVLCTMLDLAIDVDLPAIIHNRESDQDLMAILNEKSKQNLKAVVHCFTGNLDLALQILDLGLYISFSGIVTFKNAENLREVAREIPLDRILAETDSPYLAPVPMRSKRNEPSYVQYTVREIARIKGISIDELQNSVVENAKRLFTKMIIDL